MPTCIYCRQTDPPCGFNIEHVIPEALGGFKHALTLSDSEVCQECNQHFGDTLDRFLTRDSAEAMLRFGHRLKDPAEVRAMFKERVRVRLPQDGSKYGGIYLDLVPPPAGELEPFVVMVPQLGCERSDGRGWEYFTEEALRTDPELPARIQREYNRLRIVWYEGQPMKERLLTLLAEKGIGFKGGSDFEEVPPMVEGGRVTVEVEFKFDAALARAIAKIAFNYLAKTQGAAFALRPEFDAVRRFIRHGEGKPPDFVRPQEGPIVTDKRGGPPPRWHVLTLYWDRKGETIQSRLSPFNYLTYLVRLFPHFRGVWRQILSGHLYDLDTLEVRELHKTPIAPPEGHAF